MSVYMTEEEQIEAIKGWWKKYNGIILTIFSIILLSIAGYRYWNWYKERQVAQASNAYEHLMISFSNKDNKAIRAYANQIIHNHNHTVYSDVAHLTLAKLYVSKDQYDKAAIELKNVSENSTMPALKQVAKIRLARIMLKNKSYNDALNILSNTDDDGYSIIINELKGDIYATTGEYPKAESFYKLALDETKSRGLNNMFLEMKTNDI